MFSKYIKNGQKEKQKHGEQKKKRFQIENTNNFQYYQRLGLLVSQPFKYLIVQLVFASSMVYFYVLTFVTGLIIDQLNYVIIVLHVIALVSFLILGFKNPGIVLKISEDFESRTKLQIPFDRDAKPAINQLSKSYIFPMKSHFISVKFCAECLIYKPPRAVHCWICNACILNMDHHCPFIGNCVGKGNYKFFFCFVSSLIFLTILIMAQLIIMIKKLFEENELRGFHKPQLYFAGILFIFCCVVVVFVGSLGSFHIYLILNSVTTNEFCKQTWNTLSGNPFKKNFCFKNILLFVTGSRGKMIKNQKQELQQSIVPRQKNKSQQHLSQYSNQDVKS